MNQDRPQGNGSGRATARDLFARALDLDAKERTRFLDEACGSDDALRREVESLLESHDGAGGFLQSPVLPVDAVSALSRSTPPKANVLQEMPEAIGPYRIKKVLGEGGMGIVYLAEQTAPVKRDVALKVLKRGMDTKEVVARFELERQALAMMSHPGIAMVHDAGSTEQGQAYFVMEHVPGPLITEYCDSRHLTLRQRLDLFIQVCEAIQHAHQKGIIHRDIKPSNILVREHEGRPVPKIIDFGIARATDKRLFEKKTRTSSGMVIGTPEYMSPEQAGLEGQDIDTRTDIYTLGVLLYELIVGKLPIEFKRERGEDYSSIQKRIREENPLKPSQKISSLHEELKTLADNRKVTPQLFRRQLRGDLDWITMKAMEKDRARRYDTASELAADVGRFLRSEPVLAGPPSTLYVLKKFVIKNKGPVTAVLAVIFALVAGLTVSLRLYVVAEDAKSAADNLLGDYRNLADLFLIDSFCEEADALWPAWPGKIPEMKRWLGRAEELATRLEFHRNKLKAMRDHALDQGKPGQSTPQRRPVRLDDLASIRAVWDELVDRCRRDTDLAPSDELRLKMSEKTRLLEKKRAQIIDEIDSLEAAFSHQGSWQFADSEEKWLHDKLVRLVDELERFVDADPLEGEIADVRRRIDLAGEIERNTVIDQADSWKKTADVIADPAISPLYDGLRLAPQVGLIPIGRDPDSGLYEFAVYGTGETPERDEAGRIIVTPGSSVVLVLLPSGTFRMGAVFPADGEERLPNRDPYCWLGESPVHEVTLDPFFMAKHELTVGQWERMQFRQTPVPELHPALNPDEGDSADQIPMTQLTWFECRYTLNTLGLDLPTEAQWEYAARAGTVSPWYTGW